LTICGPTIKASLRCATPQGPEAYELVIDGVAHNRGFVYIDTPLLVHGGTQTGSDREQKSLERCADELSEPFEEVSVKLLSLFAIHGNMFRENFLILGRSRKHPDAYERLGLGTGIMYRSHVPDLMSLGAFAWIENVALDRLSFQPQDQLSIV
jgi:hypothetical protein